MKPAFESALVLAKQGYSLIPIRLDGSKAPDGRVLPLEFDEREGKERPNWKPFRKRFPSPNELLTWFEEAEHGLAVVCGAISGNLEVLDFDDLATYRAWRELVEAERPGAVDRCPRVRTPRGVHVYCHLASPPPGNRRLALLAGGKKASIETRGEGGYVLAPGCPKAAHPDGGLYVWERAPS